MRKDIDMYGWLSENLPDDEGDVVYLCEYCGEPIYEGEEFTRTNDGNLHEDCFGDFAWSYLDARCDVAEKEMYYGDVDYDEEY